MGYRKPVPNNVSKALGVVNQERLFYQKCIDAQIITFNDTILNTYCSFVLNKYITIDDKDPVWMNETKKLKIKAKNILYKIYTGKGRFESGFIFHEN